VILETIVTTVAGDASVNCAPMGVEWGDESIVLKPYVETATYRNVVATGSAVVNLTDDVRVFARAAISNPVYATTPAAVVRGVVLADCCAWRELEVRSIDGTPPRARIEAAIVHRGWRREFVGFNRARHAVIEAAIHATRVHLLERSFLESELARLQVIVDKTAGPEELEAMALITDYIRQIPDPKPRIPNPELEGQIPNPNSQPVSEETVFVEAPARLHFGVLDLRGRNRRWFGGVGAAAPGPTLLVSASEGERLEVHGPDADRAAGFARRFIQHYDVRRGARVTVHRALPAHSGLGSGTQLALAVGRALAELNGIDADASALARATGRARRSAIGTWTFAGGGLVVDGGRRTDGDDCGPLVARLPFPSNWQCVIAVPHATRGFSGADEDAAFQRLSAPPAAEVEHVSHLVLMGLLPAAADGDLAAFGEALGRVQEITGRWFASAQGGTFASGPSESFVERMRMWGALGVGQSSWGPAVYGLVDGRDAAAALAARVRADLDGRGAVFEGPFRVDGARVWRTRLSVGVGDPA
jgi:beta-RFAP synthase